MGIPAFITLRYQLKSKIFFFINQKLKLYEDVIKNIPELSITYDGNRIQKNMFLLKGIFIFSGKKDISKDDIQKGIVIKIKDNESNWLTHKIINKTDNLEIRTSQIKSSLNIDFDLLTDKDYFIIEALGESDNLDITYSHRIANVSKIEIGTIGIFKNVRNVFVIYLLLTAIFLIPILVIKPFKIWSFDLQPTYYNNSGGIISKAKMIDSSILKNSTSSFLTEKSIDVQNTLQNEMVDNINRDMTENNLTLQSDSLAKLASEEYSKIGLIISGKTKSYRINKDHLVKFNLDNGFWDFSFLSALILILITIVLIIDLFRMAVHYFRYKRISELASSLFQQHG